MILWLVTGYFQNEEIETNSENISEIQTTSTGFESRIAELEDLILVQQDKISSLEEDLEDFETDIETIQTSVITNSSSISDLDDSVAGLASTVSDMETVVTDFETSLSNMETTVSSNTTTISTLDGAVQSLQTSISANTSSVSTLDSTVLGLQSSVSSNASSISTNTSSISGLDTSISDLQASVEQNILDIADNLSSITTLENSGNVWSTTGTGSGTCASLTFTTQSDAPIFFMARVDYSLETYANTSLDYVLDVEIKDSQNQVIDSLSKEGFYAGNLYSQGGTHSLDMTFPDFATLAFNLPSSGTYTIVFSNTNTPYAANLGIYGMSTLDYSPECSISVIQL